MQREYKKSSKEIDVQIEPCQLEAIDEYLPTARVHPIQISRMNWKNYPEQVNSMQLVWIEGEERVRVFIVEEKKYKKDEEIRGYTIFVKPEVLYDNNLLERVYEQVFGQIIVNNKSKIFIGYPQDMKKVGEKITKGIEQEGIWYRKITS